MTEAERLTRVRRRLRIVRYVGLADLLLLIALVSSSLSGNRDLVRVLGPVHGGTFLLLLTLTITAAADGYWSWWFPIGILLSGGAVGALLGEWLVGRRLAAAHSAHEAALPDGAPEDKGRTSDEPSARTAQEHP